MQVVVRVCGQRGGERRSARREAGDWRVGGRGVGAGLLGDGRRAAVAAGLRVGALESRFGGWWRVVVVVVVVGWGCGGGGVLCGGLLG